MREKGRKEGDGGRLWNEVFEASHVRNILEIS
jgi:hypothetical protein